MDLLDGKRGLMNSIFSYLAFINDCLSFLKIELNQWIHQAMESKYGFDYMELLGFNFPET